MSKKVMIDPGHAPGNANRGPTGYYEYQGMWKLSNYLKEELTKRGVQADLTRKENEDPSLSERGNKSKGYDMFISQHSNAFNGKVRGVEVFYSLRRPNDKPHAEALAAAVSKVMNNPNRGAKTRESTTTKGLDYYGVIRSAEAVGCPHIFLCESGFHDNPIDEAFLKQDSNLKKIAEAQAEVICGILGVKYVRVQVGAFRDRQNADRLAKELQDNGYDTYMVQGDDGLYRVQTGAFKNEENARALADRLMKAGYETYITNRAGAPVVPVAPRPLRVGDKVRVRQGARTYGGGKRLASFVYNTVYDVIQVSGDRVVIGRNGAVTAAMHINDIIKD